jgi:hypothetical protein
VISQIGEVTDWNITGPGSGVVLAYSGFEAQGPLVPRETAAEAGKDTLRGPRGRKGHPARA